MNRTIGFGADPGEVGDQGVITTPPIPGLDPLKQIARDIAKIREKFVAPETIRPIVFEIAASDRQKVDLTQVEHNCFVLSVFIGTVDLWFGDFSSGRGDAPHIAVPSGSTLQLQVPPGGRVYTVGATSAGTSSFCFTPMTL